MKNRASEIRIVLRDYLIIETNEFQFTENSIPGLINNKIELGKNLIKAITEWKDWKQQNLIRGNPPKSEAEYWEFENIKIAGLRKQDPKLSQPNCFYDELDVTLRHKAFQLALHYWEGRWLLKLEKDLVSDIFKGQTEVKIKNRWYRQAMITPCFVSTFYMSPKFFTYFKYLGRFQNGNYVPNTFHFSTSLIY